MGQYKKEMEKITRFFRYKGLDSINILLIPDFVSLFGKATQELRSRKGEL